MMPEAARLSISPKASMTLLIISKLRELFTSVVMPVTALALDCSSDAVSSSASDAMRRAGCGLRAEQDLPVTLEPAQVLEGDERELGAWSAVAP